MKTTGVIIAVFLVVVILFGDPATTVANWFWSETPAPWENVHAFFCPNKGNLLVDKRRLNVGTVWACRDWVNEQAAAIGDPMRLTSDYECGVGCKDEGGGMYVCRLTVE